MTKTVHEQEHWMNITPSGTLADRVQRLWRGKGREITVRGRQYTVREYGSLSEDDSTRRTMYESMIT